MKRISTIIEGLSVQEVSGDTARFVKDIQYDSRRAGKDDLFVAVRGFQQDGHRFIPAAHQQGCRAFLVEEMADVADSVQVRVPDTRKALPYLARNFFDQVTDELKIIGITGTNGKTTTAYLLHSILQAAGWNPGLISTIETIVSAERQPTERTTPESLDLYRTLARMHKLGHKSVVMEVSSHALELHRVDGLHFTAAVFTNLGHDHLDFHRSAARYLAAKKKLFDRLEQNDRAVVNLDDPRSEEILADCNGDVITYSLQDCSATVCLKKYQLRKEGMTATIALPSGDVFISSGLIGKFNLSNLLAAAATAMALGFQHEYIVNGLENVQRVPGRSERYLAANGAQIFIDYAHTPDALQRMLEALLEYRPGKLVVVFGCGGDRDKEKRPLMGKIADDYADSIFLTNDNPRSEKPEAIIQQIREGIYDQSKVTVIPDRRSAIEAALRAASKNDIVLIAGKGHETYQEAGGKRTFFDDREIVINFCEAHS